MTAQQYLSASPFRPLPPPPTTNLSQLAINQIAYLSCGEPQKAVDTFHAVTGIIWPDYAPWPDTSSVRRRTTETRSIKQQPAAVTNGASTATPPTAADAESTEPAQSSSPPASATAKPEFPEEFRLLLAGPSNDDADALEASSWEGTGGERFLQMRTVAEQAAEHLSNRFATSVVGMDGPLKRPALGEYVGECRPNGMLVATVVKAHGRRKRLDDACRMVLRMADWGLKPDVAVFNSLAAAAVWNGRMDLALQVGRAMGIASGEFWVSWRAPWRCFLLLRAKDCVLVELGGRCPCYGRGHQGRRGRFC